MTTSALMTVQDLEQLPDDGYHYELIEGVLKRMPPPELPHGLVQQSLWLELGNYVKQHGLGVAVGEVGFLLETDPDTVLGPDIAVIPAEYLPISTEAGYERRVPPLVVEVLSPSNRRAEIEAKVAIYLRAGVRLVLVVNPRRRTVHVHTPDGKVHLLTEADELTGGDVLPGFRMPVANIFHWLT
ncbi:MAG TPA: Uma2 family endonuclease [Thermomicrobiales bacterium]|nr:Uma2 family endonuclease [Thermomicrobiales bacterium]